MFTTPPQSPRNAVCPDKPILVRIPRPLNQDRFSPPVFPLLSDAFGAPCTPNAPNTHGTPGAPTKPKHSFGFDMSQSKIQEMQDTFIQNMGKVSVK